MGFPPTRRAAPIDDAAVEIRMRCIEAAAKNPTPHNDGYAAGVLASAQQFADFVLGSKGVENLL